MNATLVPGGRTATATIVRSALHVQPGRSPARKEVPVEIDATHVSELNEFFTIGVSVRLSDRSLHMEEQKKIRQKLPSVGFETRTSGS